VSPAIAVLGLALGLVLFGRRSGGGSSWSVKDSSVKLSSSTRAFLDELARRSGVAFVVTSGRRSFEEQAEEMLGETWEQLHDLYKADHVIDELEETERTVEAWAAVIEKWAAAGYVLSWHVRDPEWAVDIRTRDFSDAEVSALQLAAAELGADVVLESDHLHLEEWAA